MAAKKQLSAKAIDQHILALPVAKTGKKNFCEVYMSARPIMIKANALLGLVKPNWSTVLTGLIDSLDDACPSATK